MPCHRGARTLPVAQSAATPSTAGTVASGASIKPGEPGEARRREALDAGDVPCPSTCRAAGQDRCRWRDRPRGPRCRHGGERRQHQARHGRRTKCIAFGNLRIDAAVSAEVLSLIAPLGLEAALQAIAERERDSTQRLRQVELALEQARYEAARSHRQYDAVDPENRLVAADLERRWNERLAEVARLEEQLHRVREHLPAAITETQRAEILALGTDVARLWNQPAASVATRKRILRTVLEEIIVTSILECCISNCTGRAATTRCWKS
jgi:hypothetical protein